MKNLSDSGVVSDNKFKIIFDTKYMEGLKKCPVCQKELPSLDEFMAHIKKEHKDIPPEDILSMGKEHKWKFRE